MTHPTIAGRRCASSHIPAPALAPLRRSFLPTAQWIFLRLHERGLAYQAEVPVNWCPALGTVLANEEARDPGPLVPRSSLLISLRPTGH